MNFKDYIYSFFKYKSIEEYQPNLPENTSNPTKISEDINAVPRPTKIFSSLNVNSEYIKSKYNALINSDMVFREFTLIARGKQYTALIAYIDGMIRNDSMDQFIIQPLIMRNLNNLYDGSPSKISHEAVTNTVSVKKVKKFNLSEYIMSSLLPQNSLKIVYDFDAVMNGINSGNCALFVDTLDLVFDIELKGFNQRSISKPDNEAVIKGPHEAFLENIRSNTVLMRRIINNENLVIENIEIGKITKTKCGLFYLSNITSDDLVAEVKYRLNNLSIDSLLSAGQLEQLISDNTHLSLPQILSTERPDKAANYLLNGRVIVIVNGSPYALILPAILSDFLNTADEKNLKPLFANFLKCLRLLASLITILLPGLYVAITSFHQEILPTDLLFSIMASRASVPFPVIIEILLLEFSFELIREAGLRVPSPIGPTIGIVGALILGQAAVTAGIISPILIIIVAVTGISSFAIPDYSFGFQLRIFRFAFILLGFMSGFLGISFGLFMYLAYLSDIKSIGVPYTLGLTPFESISGNPYFLPDIWKRENRASFLNTKKIKKQEHISMNWKQNKY